MLYEAVARRPDAVGNDALCAALLVTVRASCEVLIRLCQPSAELLQAGDLVVDLLKTSREDGTRSAANVRAGSGIDRDKVRGDFDEGEAELFTCLYEPDPVDRDVVVIAVPVLEPLAANQAKGLVVPQRGRCDTGSAAGFRDAHTSSVRLDPPVHWDV